MGARTGFMGSWRHRSCGSLLGGGLGLPETVRPQQDGEHGNELPHNGDHRDLVGLASVQRRPMQALETGSKRTADKVAMYSKECGWKRLPRIRRPRWCWP